MREKDEKLRRAVPAGRWAAGRVVDWPAVFARADALARDIVLRQTRLLIHYRWNCTPKSHGRDQ
jgi:hypothetical protein